MTIPEIQNEAAKIWGITAEQIKGKSRAVEDVAPRRAAMVACVKVFDYNMSTVDRAFGSSTGSTRNFVYAKKEMSLTDKAKCDQLLATCEKRKTKLLRSMACIKD